MNEYESKAQKFLKDHGAHVHISFVSRKPNKMWNDTEPRNNYQVHVERGKEKWNYTFHDSIHNTQNNIRPNVYDVLSCVQTYDVGSLSDFISEFGYDPEFTDAERIYKAVRKEYENWNRLFGDVAEEFWNVFA